MDFVTVGDEGSGFPHMGSREIREVCIRFVSVRENATLQFYSTRQNFPLPMVYESTQSYEV